MRLWLVFVFTLFTLDAGTLIAQDYDHKTQFTLFYAPMIIFDGGESPNLYGIGIGHKIRNNVIAEFHYSKGTFSESVPHFADPELNLQAYTSYYKQTFQIVLGRVGYSFSNSRLQPYIIGGLAWINDDSEFRDSVVSEEPIVHLEEFSSEISENSLGYDVNGGVRYFFTEAIATRIEAGFIMGRSKTLCKFNFMLAYAFN